MNISWRLGRQILIFTIYTLLIILPVIYLLYNLLSTNNSCFDNKMNGDETGIDCGGSCALRCDGTYKNIKVNFTRILKVDTDRYDIFALLDNYNTNVFFPKVVYNASVYNVDGILLLAATGTISVNSQSEGVIYIPNVNLKQEPKIIDLQLQKPLGILQLADTTKGKVNVSTWNAQKNVGGALQVIGELVNQGSSEATNVSIYALLYDDTRSVYAVSKTKIRSLKGRERTAIAYTWGDLPKPTNVEFIVVYD
jgi:hypothetical protein